MPFPAPRRPILRLLLPGLLAAVGVGNLACQGEDREAPALRPPPQTVAEREPCAVRSELRMPLFGDTHVHTALSFDAAAQDTRNRPADAFRFARGEALGIKPYDENGRATRRIQLERPLDWLAQSDHAELLGETRICNTPGTSGHWHPVCALHRTRTLAGMASLATRSLVLKGRWGIGLCGSDWQNCLDEARGAWQEIQDAAEAAYDRSASCGFTSFVGYEWTATVGTGMNLHRNVVFRNERVPAAPLSWLDTPSAIDLWDGLQRECVDALPGCDALTIPHNSNLSAGLIFQSAGIATSDDDGLETTLAEAKRRARWEPLVEMMQHKGDSECDPNATGADGLGWDADDLCAFEKLPYQSFGPQNSSLVAAERPPARSFVRWALTEGLRLERAFGANPLKFGIIASTDTHIAAAGLVAERDHPGHGGAGMGAQHGIDGLPDDAEFGPGGLAVVWAEENTRDSIFDALRRRETYGTSGSRPVVRFFGGWNYDEDLCGADQEAFARAGYQGGAPMGGDLPSRPAGAGAPRFAVSALRDPGTAANPGTPLQRVQIVKGWLENGEARERVIDVAGGPNGATVDTSTCEPQGRGADSLCSVWSDPDFDPNEPAWYYARVVENPTCRWSQYVCNAARVDCSAPGSVPEGLAGCCAPEHRPAIQERAWTSPIWFTPAS